MKRVYGTPRCARRVTVAFGLPILTSGPAFATSNGSTDIYWNEFARSFGHPMAPPSVPSFAPARWNSSTDIYRNEFVRSLGPAITIASAPPAALSCSGGSTDTYATDFQKRFATEEETHLARCP